MYSPAMDALFVLRLIGILIAAAGVGVLVTNLRRRRSWTSPNVAWARDRQLVLAVALIVIGVVIALVAVSRS